MTKCPQCPGCPECHPERFHSNDVVRAYYISGCGNRGHTQGQTIDPRAERWTCQTCGEWYAVGTKCDLCAPTPEPPRLELPTNNGTQPECRRDWRPMGQNWNAEVTSSGTEGSAEQLNPDEYYGNAKLFAEVLNYENDLKRKNADLRQRLEAAQKEILRLKEELKIVVGICASDTLPAKEKA